MKEEIIYHCGSCHHRVKKGDKIMGYCPECGRDSLIEGDFEPHA